MTKRIREFANEIGHRVEEIIDILEILSQEGDIDVGVRRHPNSNLTDEGQKAVLDYLATRAVPKRPDNKPELSGPSDIPVRIRDFAEELGVDVKAVCQALKELGEPSHHNSNISPDAQEILFARYRSEAEASEPALVETPPVEFNYAAFQEECEALGFTVADLKRAGAAVADGVVVVRTLEEADAAEDAFEALLAEREEQTLKAAEEPMIDPVVEPSTPEQDRLAIVNVAGVTVAYEPLPPGLAERIRDVLGERKVMGFTLDLDRDRAVFTSWPDGQKYEVIP